METKPDNFAGLDALITKFNTEPPAPETTPPAAPPATTQPPVVPLPSTTPPATTPPATTPPATPPATEDPPFEPGNLFGTGKQNAAFADMRTKNKAYEKALLKIGQSLGINSADPEVLIPALERKVNEHQAETTGVPLDMLEKMDALTRDAEKRDAETMASEATRGFQRVKDEFKLGNKDLSDFAAQLRDAGMNPFVTPMDLVKEYRSLNFEKILAKAKDDAIAEAAKLQQHGQNNSTQPNTAAPAAAPGSAKSVTTVSALEALMQGKSF